MKKLNAPLLLCALYLIAAYPIAFWIHEEYASFSPIGHYKFYNDKQNSKPLKS